VKLLEFLMAFTPPNIRGTHTHPGLYRACSLTPNDSSASSRPQNSYCAAVAEFDGIAGVRRRWWHPVLSHNEYVRLFDVFEDRHFQI
jgi:hypothetical protein